MSESAADIRGYAPDRRAILVRAVGLSKTYPAPDGRGPGVQLFQGLDLEVAGGEPVAIVGRSGVGKSSLLHILAGLERPSAGEVWLGSTALHRLSREGLATARNQLVGYVWQFHHLLPEFSAAENVAMPLLARNLGRRAAIAEALRWLDRVGLGDRAHHRPGELSGGEQQRTAIARALVTQPAVLLADEPTGDLDRATAAEVFGLMQRLCRTGGLAALVVTHNEDIAAQCDRRMSLESPAESSRRPG